MRTLCLCFLLMAFIKMAISNCDILFQGKVRVSVVNEAYLAERQGFPDNLTIDLLLEQDDAILTLELQRNQPALEGSSGIHPTTEEFKQEYYLSTNENRTAMLVVSRHSQTSYSVKGEIEIGSQEWTLVPDALNQKNGNNVAGVHVLTVKHCKSNASGVSTDTDTGYNIHNTRNYRIANRTPDVTRQKRSLKTYTVELLMVIDNAIYEWWKSLAPMDIPDSQVIETIKQYYAYVFKEIDTRFVSLEQELFEINMAFSGMIIAKDETESFWTATSTVEGDGDGPRVMVNSSEALEKFQQWLADNSDLPSYDHAILFTGSNLIYAGSPGNTGLAFEASMCRNISNSSIVEEAYDERTVTFAVRQIARSLGVRDDMDNNDCLEFFNFIMAPKFKLPIRSFPSNRWLFSSCSTQYFKDYIDSLNEVELNCLQEMSLTERFPVELSQRVEELPGKYYRAREQCKNKFGKESDICRMEIGAKYSKLCSGLMCTVPETDECDVILPADGTPCGNMKYCYGGECSSFEDADRRLDSCVFGNEPEMQCANIVSITPAICYNETVRYKCCMSCATRETGLKGCEYGDRILGCIEEECHNRTENYKNLDCCLTCSDELPLYTIPIADFLTSVTSKTARASRTSTVKASSAKYLPTSTGRSNGANMFGTSDIHASTSDVPYATLNANQDELERRRQEFGRPDLSTVNPFPNGMKNLESTTALITKLLQTTPLSAKDLTTAPSSSVALTNVVATTPMVKSEDETVEMKSVVTASDFPNQQIKSTTPSSGITSITTKECITNVILNRPHVKHSNMVSPTDVTPTTMTTPVRQRTRQPIINTEQRTMPAHVYTKEHVMNIYDRIFFKELARSMRRNQRGIYANVKQSIKFLYTSVSRRIGSFLETEGEHDFTQATNTVGETPSNDDDDLNRQLKPIWLKRYRRTMRDLETNIKQMRYRVLMMVNRHLRQ